MRYYNKQKKRQSQAKKRNFSEKFSNFYSGLAVPVGSDALCRGKDLIPSASAGAAKPDFVSDNNSSSNKLNPSFKASGGEFEGGQSHPSKHISKHTNYLRKNTLNVKPTQTASLDTKKQVDIFVNRYERLHRLKRDIADFIKKVAAKYHGENLFERAENISECSTEFRKVECLECGCYYAGSTTNACHDRFCPICAVKRSAERAERLVLQVAEALRWNKRAAVRFLTLTVANPSLGKLAETLDKMQGSWRKLRRLKYFKERVLGGFKSLEITYNSKNKTWHPHFHILLIGRFVEQGWLADNWEKYTGARIVDIRRTGSLEKQVKEVAKYITKFTDKEGNLDAVFSDVDAFYELQKALSGRRVITTFGCLYKISDEVKEEIETQKQEALEESRTCPCCGSKLTVDTGYTFSIVYSAKNQRFKIPPEVLLKFIRQREWIDTS